MTPLRNPSVNAFSGRALALLLAAMATAPGCTKATDVGDVVAVRITPQVPVQVVRLGQTYQLTATCLDVAQKPVTGPTINWTTANPSVATVSADGLVTAHLIGTAAITAECQKITSQITIQVTAVPVTSVTITPPDPTVLVGSQTQLTAVPRDSANNVLALQGRVVSWTSNNIPVASVSGLGVLLGVSKGVANVQVTVDGVTSTPITVTVNNVPVASVQIVPTGPLQVRVGQTLQLTPVLRDTNGAQLSQVGRDISWTTSNAAAAPVTVNGLVSGQAVGSATITVTVEGKTDAVTVNVVP